MNIIKLKQLNPLAKVPTQGSYAAACFDLYAAEDAWVSAGATVMVSTGWAFEIPAGFCVMIYARSSLASQHGVRPANCVGVIDADYRGEVLVPLRNDSNQSYRVIVGDRVAQFKLERVERTALMVVDELDETARDVGGFGSSGR